ncbi:chemotaxis protein MotB [Paracoccus isoporae]|uniref:Chemotaxis protein MotB n=1 Tax=Paracoccus isoporae TaxID=591205 RepID=A0A1G6V2S4_9RHOB|nr:flagellar motor protein MotB [Paracoccus isoporae]SDD47794.1 chemotaxis protein MotB [Paracoccus isoporae]
MVGRDGNSVVLIRRVQPAQEPAHHGGAWKVAYADFVTAMMAFFLLMWLLDATTEKQREGLADYFNPTVVRQSSGSEGGDRGRGEPAGPPAEPASADAAARLAEMERRIQTELAGIGADSLQAQNLLRHVVTRISDEGLVIELSDLADAPLFAAETTEPTASLRELSRIVARVVGRTRNPVAVSGHVRAYPAVLARSPIWDLSLGRADQVRQLLEDADLPPRRIARVTGHGDRRSLPADPSAETNNRIEVILLK